MFAAFYRYYQQLSCWYLLVLTDIDDEILFLFRFRDAGYFSTLRSKTEP